MAANITYSLATNIITLDDYPTGARASLTDIHTADLAGSVQLLSHVVSGNPDNAVTLTTQIRPAESLALLITFTSDNGASIGTIDIVGTDAWDNAQTDTALALVGGTVATTKYYKTITTVDFNAMDTETCTVTQPRWGTYWKQGSTQLYSTAKIVVGNGTNQCWLEDTVKNLTFANSILGAGNEQYIDVARYGHVVFGAVYDAGDKVSQSGCSFVVEEGAGYFGSILRAYNSADSSLDLYSCQFYGGTYVSQLQRVSTMWNCLCDKKVSVIPMTSSDIFNLNIIGASDLYLSATSVYNRITALKCDYALRRYGASDVSVSNVYARGCTYIYRCQEGGAATKAHTLINVDSDVWAFLWSGANNAGVTVYRKYTIDIHVSDEDGNDIADGTTVYCYNGAGTELFSEATTSGAITQQTETHGTYIAADLDVMTDLGPHVIEIHPHGYEPYRWEGDLDEKIDWRISLKKKPCNSMHSTINIMRSVA